MGCGASSAAEEGTGPIVRSPQSKMQKSSEHQQGHTGKGYVHQTRNKRNWQSINYAVHKSVRYIDGEASSSTRYSLRITCLEIFLL